MISSKRMLTLLSALFLGAAPALAQAQQGPGKEGPAVGEARQLADLPQQVQALLGVGKASDDGGIADRGEKFEAGCIRHKDVPNQRFVSAAFKGNTIAVEVEHGGFAHYVDTVEFQVVGGKWEAKPRAAPASRL